MSHSAIKWKICYCFDGNGVNTPVGFTTQSKPRIHVTTPQVYDNVLSRRRVCRDVYAL